MKLAVISGPSISVPPKTYGGGELFIYNLCETLFDDYGYDITLFTTGDSVTKVKTKYLYKNSNVMPQNILDESRHIFWAIEEIKKDSFDIVQANYPISLIYSNFLDIPMVYTVHHPKNPYVYDFYSKYQNVNYVVPSEFQKNNLKDSSINVTKINHGIDSDFYDYSDNNKGYIAYLGRLAYIKGVHLAIDSCILSNEILKIAGSCVFPKEYQYFEQILKFKLNNKNIEYIGEIGGKEKVIFLKNAKALIAPSIIDETFGLVIIEALMCGTPVIASNRGSFTELISHGVTGFLVNPENIYEVSKAIKDISLIDRKTCRRVAVEKFSRKKMAKNYHKLFTNVKNVT